MRGDLKCVDSIPSIAPSVVNSGVECTALKPILRAIYRIEDAGRIRFDIFNDHTLTTRERPTAGGVGAGVDFSELI